MPLQHKMPKIITAKETKGLSGDLHMYYKVRFIRKKKWK